MTDEREAICQLKGGDIGGLEALVRLHQTKALRVAYLIVRDHPLAEDIVQTAFLRAYERIHQFDAARPFAPWFLRCVTNDALKAVARRDRHVALDSVTVMQQVEQTVAEIGLDEMMAAGEMSEVIAATLNRLSPPQRAALVLRYYLGLSDEEISQQLNCAPGTVRWRLSVARQRMRQMLPDWLTQSAEK